MYRIANDSGNIEMLFYDFIEDNCITAQEVVSALSSVKRDIRNVTIRVNSRGGDLGEALGIYNYLKSLNVSKTAYIDGVAMSSGTIIALAGDKVIMPEDAVMMIHNPWTYCEGEADDMRSMAESLDKWRDICVNIYMKKTGLSREEIIEMMDKQTEMTGTEALMKGFVDELAGEARDEIRNAYEAGVKAERERLRELDELMTSDRRAVIDKAKYETYAKANDIAKELLKQTPQEKHYEARVMDSYAVRGICSYSERQEEERVLSGASILNRMRGYK